MGSGGKGTCRLRYETDLRQLYGHFKFSVFFFRQRVALSSASSSCCSGAGVGGEAAKQLGELELFLAHIAPFCPDYIGGLLDNTATSCPSTSTRLWACSTTTPTLPSGLKVHLVLLTLN
jgi:hypothetical protein